MARKTIASLNIQVGASTATLSRDLKGAGGVVKGFGRDVDSVSGSLGSFGSRIGGLAAKLGGFLGVTGGAAGVGFATKMAADLEKTEVAFRVMLGSGEQAKTLLSDLSAFAAATPFQLPELQAAARVLLAFNEPAGQMIETLRRIGDVSAAIDAPIGEIAEIYGKARVQGRLFMEDINQLTGRGIPIIQELAKQFRVNDSAVRELVSNGQVGFANLEAAFKSMTGTGGQFAGMMAAQSETLAGKFSTLQDNIGALFREIGTKLLPAMKSLVDFGIYVTSAMQGLDVETVRTVAQITAMAAAFGAVLFVIPRIVAAIKTIVTAIRAMTSAQVIAQAFSGPAGWASLAAGAAIAAGAYYGVGKAFDAIEASAAKAAATSQQAGAALKLVKAPDFGPPNELTKELAAAGKQITERLQTPLEKLDEELNQVNKAFGAGAIDVRTWERALADLGRRAREATPLVKFADDLNKKFANPLKPLLAEMRQLDAALKKGLISWDVYGKAIEDVKSRMRDTDEWNNIGEQLTDKFKTPMQQLREQILLVTGAMQHGKISAQTYRSAMADAFGQFDEATKRGRSLRDLVAPTVGAVTRGTTAGFSAVNSGQNTLRGMVDVARRAEISAKERTRLLTQINAGIGRMEIALRDGKPVIKNYRI